MTLRHALGAATMATALVHNATAQRIQDLSQEDRDLQTGKRSMILEATMSMGPNASSTILAVITRKGPDFQMEIGVNDRPIYVTNSPCTNEALRDMAQNAASRLRAFPPNPQFSFPNDLKLLVEFTAVRLQIQAIPAVAKICGISLSTLTPTPAPAPGGKK